MTSKQARSVQRAQSRRAARLNRNLEKNLFAYAAAAAGGLLSTTLPAEGQIIYTPSNIRMHVAEMNKGPALTLLDLTNNGKADFSFVMTSTSHFYSYSGNSHFKNFLKIVPAAGNAVVQGKLASTASAVPAGVKIGPNEKFAAGGRYLMIKSYKNGVYRNSGTWEQVEYAYVGLKFLIEGQVHYGWARIKFPYPGGTHYPSIYGYAYESTPNRPIVTGQTSGSSKKSTMASAPATLGLLAIGASGIDAWRTKKTADETH